MEPRPGPTVAHQDLLFRAHPHFTMRQSAVLIQGLGIHPQAGRHFPLVIT